MKNTLKAQCLLEAASNYYDAKREHDEARDAYEGESWGYYGSEYVERMEQAAEEFQNYFRDLMKQEAKQ